MVPDLELAFGFSPCPNDTFAFWAAVHGAVPAPGVTLRIGAMADIEELNRRAVEQRAPLPVTKLSVPALAAVTDRYAVLPAGAALGFGCGPLVVRRADDAALASLDDLAGRRVAIPGRHTTAALLLGLLAPRGCQLVEARFDRVMPMVARGECDAGLVIHEGRFTYRQHQLVAIADLGELWERGAAEPQPGPRRRPLPLGVIAMRRDLGRAAFDAVAGVLRASVERARRDPEAPRAFVRAHAQELRDEVCDRHIALYVNEFTVELGARGRAAIDALLRRGRAAGLLPDGPPPWWSGAGERA